jgi:hydrogenase expression/formation protein HypD
MGNYIDEFRNSDTAGRIAKALNAYSGRKINIMEVCGTHTMAIFRYGIRDILPQGINLISGPGCPVCVTPVTFVDAALEITQNNNAIITTFGDMLRIPGSGSSLDSARASGADVRIVYSPLDALVIARENPDKKVVFLSVGFETTTPVVALSVLKAYNEGLRNYFILGANKTMPEALKMMVGDSSNNIDGYLYPGHVSAITGIELYEEIFEKYHIPGVVAGFEPLDILHAIYTVAKMIEKDNAGVMNEYSRVVKREGNTIALEKMYEAFEPSDSIWRGLGSLPGSGMSLRKKYEAYDAWKAFGLSNRTGKEPVGCMCGEVLKGRLKPLNCGLFGTACTPRTPVGACMVSSEGTCSAYYRYGRNNI